MKLKARDSSIEHIALGPLIRVRQRVDMLSLCVPIAARVTIDCLDVLSAGLPVQATNVT